MTVVAVVERARSEAVVIEAANCADDLDTALHVVHVLPLSRYASLEVRIADRLGIPVGLDAIRERAARIADEAAGPVAEEYEAIGLVGHPVKRVRTYAERVDADRIVVDAEPAWRTDVFDWFGDPIDGLRKGDVPVVPVY